MESFSRVVGSIPKEQLPTHIKLVRDAVSTARDKERRRRKVLLRLELLKFVFCMHCSLLAQKKGEKITYPVPTIFELLQIFGVSVLD